MEAKIRRDVIATNEYKTKSWNGDKIVGLASAITARKMLFDRAEQNQRIRATEELLRSLAQVLNWANFTAT